MEEFNNVIDPDGPNFDQDSDNILDYDTDGDGVTDDAGELGATYSDDLCVVEASQSPPCEIKPSIVLQRGAYIPAKLISTKQFLHSDRVLILCQGKDESWSFVLDW